MRSKKSLKYIDTGLRLCEIIGTHGNTKNTLQRKMRTKALLLGAAALAAGLMTSQAQVYSANVVGYANVATPNGGTYLITVPFNVGVSNGANEVFSSGGTPTLPDGSSLLVWTGAGYTTYFSDSTSPSLWDDASFNQLTGAPVLPVGEGFFLIPAGSVTNTFVGTVAVNVGTSNVVTLANGGTYLVAPSVPYAGAITNGNPVTGAGGPGLSSLNGLPDGSSLLIWTGAGYTTYFSDSGSPSLWDDSSFNNLPSPPSISVGQGFFIIPAGTFNWKVGL